MTAPTPAISVIMNAYNGAAYLREAVGSALAQTFADWELIFWDDRSTDDSAEVFRSFRDPRLRYFLAPTRTPLGPARIDAVAHARGAWIAFLDQDDVWTPTKLERQMALAQAPGADRVGLIYGRALLLDPSGRRRVHDHRHEFSPLPEGDIFRSLVEDSCYIAMSTAMVRASAYAAVGGIRRGYDLAIDYHLYLALARRFEARALQDVCCLYRTHADSLSGSRALEVHTEVLRILDEFAADIDPAMLARRRRVHESLVAVEECRRGMWGRGLSRALRRGSASYLLSRPAARLWRRARRTLRAPMYGQRA